MGVNRTAAGVVRRGEEGAAGRPIQWWLEGGEIQGRRVARRTRGGGARERFYGEYRSCIDASQQNRHRRAHQLREDSTAPPSGITMTGHLIKLEYRSHPTHPCDEANSTYVLLDAGGTTGVVF